MRNDILKVDKTKQKLGYHLLPGFFATNDGRVPDYPIT